MLETLGKSSVFPSMPCQRWGTRRGEALAGSISIVSSWGFPSCANTAPGLGPAMGPPALLPPCSPPLPPRHILPASLNGCCLCSQRGTCLGYVPPSPRGRTSTDSPLHYAGSCSCSVPLRFTCRQMEQGDRERSATA